VPAELRSQLGTEEGERRLDELNQRLLTAVEKSGEAFLSNALVGGRFALRACIVNFHTSLDDIDALPGMLVRLGRAVSDSARESRSSG
jgi:hypothetical protein